MIAPLTAQLTAWLRDPVTGLAPRLAARPPLAGLPVVPSPRIVSTLEEPQLAVALPADAEVTVDQPLVVVGALLEDAVQLGDRLVDEGLGRSSIGLGILIATIGDGDRTEYLHAVHLARVCEAVLRPYWAHAAMLDVPDVDDHLVVGVPDWSLAPLALEGTALFLVQLAMRFPVIDRYVHGLSTPAFP